MNRPTPAEDKQADPPPRRGSAASPRAVLDAPATGPLEVGAGTAIRLAGTLEAAGEAIDDLRIRVGELDAPLDSIREPQPGGGSVVRWWVVLPVPPSAPPGRAPIVLVARFDGVAIELDLGEVELIDVAGAPEGTPAAVPAGGRTIAICMATYDPPEEWLVRQLDSIRAQTWEDWICLISDDGSAPGRFAALEAAVAGDSRFVVSRSPRRLGFYRNFERALRMVPPGAELVALSDQDDRWHPDKLAALAATLDASPGAALAYSDMRVADERGEILSETFWYLQSNGYEDIASLILANTVTGGASLFRRELLELALPFPPAFSDQHYHDHWLALCALATGDLAYLDRPTYDYTRHDESVTVQAASGWFAPAKGRRGRLRLRWRRMTRRLRMIAARPDWRAVYLDRYLLIRQYVAVLELRAGDRIAPRKGRALERLARAERSPGAVAWLFARSLRPLIGRTETLGRERVLLCGLLWRWTAGLRSRR